MTRSQQGFSFVNLLLGSVSLLLLAGLAWLGFQLVQAAPAGYVLEAVHLQPRTQPVTLGFAELGQQEGPLSADRQHLQARFDQASGHWLLANVSARKQVRVTGADGASYELRRLRLEASDRVQVGKVMLQVAMPAAGQLLLSSENPPLQAEWNGSRLSVKQQANFAGCPKAWRQYIPAAVRGWLTDSAFSIGGMVQCYDRLALPDVPLNQARIGEEDGQYYLYPQGDGAAVTIYRGEQVLHPQGFETPADNIQSMIIGKTAYRVTLADTSGGAPELVLSPQGNTLRHIFAAQPDSREGSVWSQTPHWMGEMAAVTSPGAATIVALTAGVLIFVWLAWALVVWRESLPGRGARWEPWLWLGVPVAAWVLGTIMADQLAWLLALVWVSWLWLALALLRLGKWRGIHGVLWLVILAVVGLGALTLSQLAAGAGSTRQLPFALRHLQILLLIPPLACVLALLPGELLQRAWGWLAASSWRWWLLAGLVLVLIAQVFLGDEKGVAGMQPIELAKTTLVLLLAGFVLNWQEMRLVNARGFQSAQARLYWLGRFLWVLAVAAAIVILVAFGVHDFSPILIVGGLLLAYLWLLVGWKVRVLLVLGLAGMLSGGILLQQHPGWVSAFTWLPQADRLQIWVQPWQYPDTGHQLQLALQAVHGEGGEAGWRGQGWFGSNGAVMGVPAIHNDFILAFFLHKAGGIAGLLLLVLQLAWLVSLFVLVDKLRRQGQQTSREQRLPTTLLAYILYGMAWMQALHWLIAWSNALGLLPIMGQPMTWVASGNSHLLAVGFPTLLLGVLAGLWLLSGQSGRQRAA